jgi:hypothetical protein
LFLLLVVAGIKGGGLVYITRAGSVTLTNSYLRNILSAYTQSFYFIETTTVFCKNLSVTGHNYFPSGDKFDTGRGPLYSENSFNVSVYESLVKDCYRFQDTAMASMLLENFQDSRFASFLVSLNKNESDYAVITVVGCVIQGNFMEDRITIPYTLFSITTSFILSTNGQVDVFVRDNLLIVSEQ